MHTVYAVMLQKLLRAAQLCTAFTVTHAVVHPAYMSHLAPGLGMSFPVTAGSMEAAEVVQLFVAPAPALLQSMPAGALPKKSLKGFARVTVPPGGHQVVQLPLSSKDFQHTVAAGERLSHVHAVWQGPVLREASCSDVMLHHLHYAIHAVLYGTACACS